MSLPDVPEPAAGPAAPRGSGPPRDPDVGAEGTDATRGLPLVVVLATAAAVASLWEFVAEDAFITYRYAANLVERGALVFNAGEPVDALTSPLHALLSAALFLLDADLARTNRWLGLLCLVATGLLVHRRAPDGRVGALALALAILPVPITLWATGGLETPLLLVVATLAASIALDPSRRRGPIELAALTGIALLLRHDALFFVSPLLGLAVLRAGRARLLPVLALAATPPATWLLWARWTYGDPLPTSFYAKTPTLSSAHLVENLAYQLGWLALAGLLPAALVLWLLGRGGRRIGPRAGHVAILAGCGLQLLYGLTMATHHMMFSLRSFAPYLPAAVLGVLALAPRDPDRRAHRLLAWAVGAQVVLQLLLSVHVRTRSLDGVQPLGEYQRTGVVDYLPLLEALEDHSRRLREHWDSLPQHPDRPPRISTFAAGVLPFADREVYVYETLVSYRHALGTPECTGFRAAADYHHLLVPRHGSSAAQMARLSPEVSPVASTKFVFGGTEQTLLLLWDPHPGPHRLGPRIDSPCRSGGAGDDLSSLHGTPGPSSRRPDPGLPGPLRLLRPASGTAGDRGGADGIGSGR